MVEACMICHHPCMTHCIKTLDVVCTMTCTMTIKILTGVMAVLAGGTTAVLANDLNRRIMVPSIVLIQQNHKKRRHRKKAAADYSCKTCHLSMKKHTSSHFSALTVILLM